LAQPAGFFVVGEGDGTDESWVYGFTSDGTMAVGDNRRTGQFPPLEYAYRWTPEGGRINATDAGLWSMRGFNGISRDGSTIVGGMTTNSAWTDRRAFIVRTGEPLLALPILAGFRNVTEVLYISGDGSVVTGTCRMASGTPATHRGFRWTAAGGVQAIPYPVSGHNFAIVTGISRDGGTIVGYSANTNTGATVAFRWRAATGSVVLPAPITQAEAHGVNADGTIIVGRYYGGGRVEAVYWDADLAMHFLGTLSWPTRHEAHGVSDDGRLITGFASQSAGSTWRAVVWPNRDSPQLASDYFASKGVTIPTDWTPQVVDSVSGNGRAFGFRFSRPVIGGNRSAIVILPAPCVADFNQDGGVDGGDVESFFESWTGGVDDADVNEDGGIDGADVEGFFVAWETGGC
jgi:uncharacterized membrane protein